MKLKVLILLVFAGLCFMSCSDDCTQTITYTKATAVYEDVKALRDVPLNAETREIEDAGKIYVGDDFILIGEEGKGIHVVNNGDINNPVPVGFIAIPRNREFIVTGNTLYAETQYDMLAIDISDLSNVKLISRHENYIPSLHANEEGEELIGFDFEVVQEKLDCNTAIISDEVNFFAWNEQLIPPSTVPSSFSGSSAGTSGTINKLATANGHLYAITSNDLHVFDVSSDLTLVNTLSDFSSQMETIIIEGEEAFIGKVDGMEIVNISVPSSPITVNEFWHPEACDPVLPHVDVAYVTLRTDGPCQGRQNVLDVVSLDRSNFNLDLITVIPMASPFGMTIVDNVLYVGEGENGLKTFDVTERESPVLIEWNQDVTAYDIIMHPTRDVLLLAGPDGMSQYGQDETNSTLTLVSHISF